MPTSSGDVRESTMVAWAGSIALHITPAHNRYRPPGVSSRPTGTVD
jgi:hypothetical protein